MKKVNIVIYKFTGKQGFFTIPESVCEECDLTVRAVKDAIEYLNSGIEVTLRIKGWWINIFKALLKGCWHAPCVFINNKLVSHGIVPKKHDIIKFIIE